MRLNKEISFFSETTDMLKDEYILKKKGEDNITQDPGIACSLRETAYIALSLILSKNIQEQYLYITRPLFPPK